MSIGNILWITIIVLMAIVLHIRINSDPFRTGVPFFVSAAISVLSIVLFRWLLFWIMLNLWVIVLLIPIALMVLLWRTWHGLVRRLMY